MTSGGRWVRQAVRRTGLARTTHSLWGWAAMSVWAVACAAAPPPSFEVAPDASAAAVPDAASVEPGLLTGDSGATCSGLGCQQVRCQGGEATTLRGAVFDPAGKTPLYNAIVYVPNAPLAPFDDSVTCDRCGALASGSPLVSTLTNARGEFVLNDVPAGEDVPLVIQVGKWRRRVSVPRVTACRENVLRDTELTRLPRNKQEGDIPQFALVTGGCDALECLFRKIGLDDSEFTAPSGSGRVHLYRGVGGKGLPKSSDAGELWTDGSKLARYDALMLACECDVHAETKPAAALDALRVYTERGGRVFATHYHHYWFSSGSPDFRNVATWAPAEGNGDSRVFSIDTTFPKGKAFADWLVHVGASTTPAEIRLTDVRSDVTAVDPQRAQRWIYEMSGDQAPKYFSFNTPVSVASEAQCGRVVFSDVHVAGGDTAGSPFPEGCTTGELSPQEKALEFLLFDLAACIQKDQDEPSPPR